MQRILLVFIATCLSLTATAQDANNLAVDATVKDQNGGRLTSAKVSLIQDGSLVNKVTTGRNGRFDLYLDFGHEYIIEIAKSGFVSKRLYINTHNVPEDEQAWGYEFGGFVVDLFKEVPGLDYSILDDPIGKVYYDPNIQNFEYDRSYTKLIRAKIDKLQDDYEDMLERQEERLQQLDEDYELAMRDAQNALDDGDLIGAKENFMAASGLKPSESEPKKKIAEIEAQIAAKGASEDRYMAALASADQLFAEAKYTEAKAKYKEAGSIKPDESYPKDRVAECNKRIAEQKAKAEAEAALAAKDKKYNDAIAKGDSEFDQENYQNAKAHYQNALALKDESHPKERLKVIETKLAELAALEKEQQAQAELDAKYGIQIDKADAAFNSGNYDNAKRFYAAASEIKPAETYPKDQLAKIEEKLAESAALAAQEEEKKRQEEAYRKLISDADKLFSSREYEGAKGKYEEALTMKSTEQYPKDRIAEIERKLEEIAQQQKAEQDRKLQEQQFNELIAEADKHMTEGEYEDARGKYNAALEVKPGENYPKQQLSKIVDLLARAEKQRQAELAQAELSEKYDSHIKAADEAFEREDFTTAKARYQEALNVKSSERYPKDQIAAIDKKMAELAQSEREAAEAAALLERYNQAIAKADEAFEAEELNEAISLYESAKGIKSDERYPDKQIALIRERLATNAAEAERLKAEAERNKAYNELIAEADGLFESEDFGKARVKYAKASEIMESERHPKDRITAIDKLLEEKKNAEEAQKERDRIEAAYKTAIAAADAFMSSRDYDRAKAQYEKAQGLKPDETYPADQIKKIKELQDEMLAREQAENEQREAYNEWIRKGDQAILDQDWEAARNAYRQALNIFENEPIPKSRLDEIDELERRAEEERLKEQYGKAIAEADRNFLSKDYAASQSAYRKALEFKPGDSHATARLRKIEEILSSSGKTEDGTVAEAKKEIIEETYDEGRSKVTIRKVRIGEREDVYKRVVHSWGGKYYFLNERPITELVWNKETTP